jgi:selenide,water dikinase
MSDLIKLTQLSKSGGCSCKIDPEKLRKLLVQTNHFNDNQLIVDSSSWDDAAVYDLRNGLALISTVDFFTPMVNDPYDFGRIAAANALSDVYAMGGKPSMALAILGFPSEKVSIEMIAQIRSGAAAMCLEAGVNIAGGHTIESEELFFGLSVNGFAPLSNIKKNSTACAGDLLLLTKPLGTGILTAALKKDRLPDKTYHTLLGHLTMLNKIGADLGHMNEVSAMTDITGFGLLGHLSEMCMAANVSANLFYDKIPVYPDAISLASQLVYPDMTTRNFNAIASQCNELSFEQLLITCDPQTNGGLLLAVAPDGLDAVVKVFEQYKISYTQPIGCITESNEKLVTVL